MLPDWMTGGTAKPAPKQGPAKPEPGPVVPGPPVLRPSREASPSSAQQRDITSIPSWLRGMFGDPGRQDQAGGGTLQTPAPLNQGPRFNPWGYLQDELGMKAGALTPAAELAKESNPTLDTLLSDLASRDQADAGTREKLKPRGTGLKPQQMTREEYLGLPAEARAAVDFNTMLVQARNIDRASRKAGEAPELQRSVNTGTVTVPGASPWTGGMPVQTGPMTTSETLPDGYGDVYEAVFGERPTRLASVGMGPDAKELDTPKLSPIAPEVLSVLKQIGYKSDDPDDMRAFLKLDNGISQSDIDNYLKDDDNDDKVSDSALTGLLGGPVKSEREQFVENIVGLTQKLEEKLAKGDKMIADFQTSALRAREGDRMTAGAKVDPMERPFGFGEGRKAGIIEDVDGAFRDTYNYLLGLKDPQQVAADLQQFNTLLQEQGVNPGAFASYMSTRLDNNERYELPIGDDGGKTKYRTPDEYRELLGLARKEG